MATSVHAFTVSLYLLIRGDDFLAGKVTAVTNPCEAFMETCLQSKSPEYLQQHAIEYLADEHLVELDDVPMEWRSGGIEAIQLVMATNRRICLECPEVPTLRERITTFISVLRSSYEC